MITSVAVSGKAPYKQVISQGFTLDGKGHKMSKSLGNTIVPNDVIKQMGAEIIRLWVLSADTSADVRVSMGSFQQIAESYRKIRNTFRFLLSNVADFDPEKNQVAFDDLEAIDRYMQIQANEFTKDILDDYATYDFMDIYKKVIKFNDYATYDFMDIYKKVIKFITTDLSAFYLDIAKDVIYIEEADGHKRRSMQTVLYDIVVRLAKLLTPILPHTTEEVWEYLHEPEEFAQLSEMPAVNYYDGQKKLLENWSRFMKVRSNVYKSLEIARDDKMIGKSFEAHVKLYVTDGIKQELDSLDADIRQAMIV